MLAQVRLSAPNVADEEDGRATAEEHETDDCGNSSAPMMPGRSASLVFVPISCMMPAMIPAAKNTVTKRPMIWPAPMSMISPTMTNSEDKMMSSFASRRSFRYARMNISCSSSSFIAVPGRSSQHPSEKTARQCAGWAAGRVTVGAEPRLTRTVNDVGVGFRLFHYHRGGCEVLEDDRSIVVNGKSEHRQLTGRDPPWNVSARPGSP